MPDYKFKARNASSEVVAGIIQAGSEDLAVETLNDRKLTIITLREQSKGGLQQQLSFFGRAKPKDIVIFARQLSVLVSASIPLVQALKIMVKQTSNERLKSIVSEIADDVEGGAKLSDSFARHKETFDDFFVNIIRSGEASGKLDEVLKYLADQQEKDYDLTSKIKGAMIYPAFVVGGMIVVGSMMMIFVVPNLTSILTESDVALPFATRMLIGASDFMVSFWWLLLIMVVGLGVGFRFALQSESFRLRWDTYKLKIPVFGKLWQQLVVVRFSRSLHTLVAGGISLTVSLKIVGDVVNNYFYRDLIMQTRKEVEDGNPIATAFTREESVPPMVSQMLEIGERTGRLEEILIKLSEFYTREVDNMVANLVTLLEPAVMVFMGVAVGFMVAAIILPTYNLASSF
ncbi:hypothetical protein CL634_07105 [bacterium]|nr:hypothetical protein [bacterium]